MTGSQSSSVHRWENVQLDCYTDTLRVNYTNYMYHGLEDLQYYRIREVRLECTNHVSQLKNKLENILHWNLSIIRPPTLKLASCPS